MSFKRGFLIIFEVFFVIVASTLFYILFINFIGLGPSKIYSDRLTFWVTSIIPILVFLGSAGMSYLLHRKQKKLGNKA
ncbi:MAG: hypothetical protein ED557_12110 [Balneola sp.]|nr:MAG: hypothetical protein ED557_12110 [Balneola sp.]